MRFSNTAVGFDGRRLVALRHDVRSLFSTSPADRSRLKRQMLEDGAALSWVECAYESEWHGHPSGSFAFTPENLADIKRLFDDGEQPLPFLYGHPRHDLGLAIDAAGWIQALDIRPGDGAQELWALVEWTDEAAEKIKAGKQRFCSVVVDFAPIDRATGEPAGLGELFEIGLVGSPFLPGMTPITLSRVGAPARPTARSLSMDPKKVLSAIAKALGLPDTAAPEKMKRAFDALVALMGAMSEEEMAPETIEELSASKDAEAKLSRIVARAAKLAKSGVVRKLADDLLEPPAEEATETAGSMVLGKLVTATGLDEAGVVAGVEANLDAIAALITGTPAAGMSSDAPALAAAANLARVHELTSRANAQAAQIATLTADLAKRTAVETEARITASFSRLVAEGKAGEGERATFVSLSAKSEEIALAAYDARTPVLPPAGQIGSGPKAAPPAKTPPGGGTNADPRFASFQKIARAEGLKGAEKIDARAAVLLSNADRFTTNTDA